MSFIIVGSGGVYTGREAARPACEGIRRGRARNLLLAGHATRSAAELCAPVRGPATLMTGEGMMKTENRRAKGVAWGRRTLCYAAGALLFAAAAMNGVRAQLPPAQTSGGVEYVTGGFGADMAQAFKEAQSGYPLALTFAAADGDGGSRPYVADVHVVIRRADGSAVLDVPSAGPYLLVRLDPGRYVVEATYLGDSQTHDVTVKEGGPAQRVFTWERR